MLPVLTLLAAILPAFAQDQQPRQAVLSSPPDAPKFSSPFKPQECAPYQHMAQCPGVTRSDGPSVNDIQLRESKLFIL